MYPNSTWSEFCNKLESAPRKDARYRSFVRHLFANTEEVSLDAQGRVLLPAVLREMAGIKRDAVLAGTLTRVEIWPAEGWRSANLPPDNMADLMTELGLY
jgi:MraZ protein